MTASQNPRANKAANREAWLNPGASRFDATSSPADFETSEAHPSETTSLFARRNSSGNNSVEGNESLCKPFAQTGTSRPLVGVVPTHLPGEASLRLPDRYSNALIAAGATPVVLPVVDDLSVYEALFPLLDAFILTGGKDIDPARYREAINPNDALCQTLSEFEPKREELEGLVLRYAKAFDVPTLGICRGMQVINVFFGGTLYIDLEQQHSMAKSQAIPYSARSEYNDGDCFGPHESRETSQVAANFSDPTKLTHWQKKAYDIVTHEVNLVAGSRVASIMSTEKLAVNSMHHQGVREVAPSFVPTAFATDGLVEAIEDPAAHFLMGVQWHPEFFAGDKGMGCLFDTLIAEARAYHDRRSGDNTTLPQQLVITPMHPSAWPEAVYGDYI